MKLFVLLLVLPLYDSLTTNAPTGGLYYCYSLTTAFINKWSEAADIPTPALAKQIAEECRVPLECMEENKANNGTIYTELGLLSLFGQICESYDSFAGPFGECFQQLRERRSSPLVYKCAAYIGSMGYNITNCEFYKSGRHCAQTLLTDRCGEEVAGMLEEQSKVLIGQFVCANGTLKTTTEKPETTKKFKNN